MFVKVGLARAALTAAAFGAYLLIWSLTLTSHLLGQVPDSSPSSTPPGAGQNESTPTATTANQSSLPELSATPDDGRGTSSLSEKTPKNISAPTTTEAPVVQPNQPKGHILYLNSYDQQLKWSQEILDEIDKVIRPDDRGMILHVENMDTKRIPLNRKVKDGQDWEQMLLEVYKMKYEKVRFSLVFSSDDNAYLFLVHHYRELFDGYEPVVVHCGVNTWKNLSASDEDEEGKKVRKNFTGIPEMSFPRETLTIMQELLPELKQVYVINDRLETGMAWENYIKSQLTNEPEKAPVISNKIQVTYEHFECPAEIEHYFKDPSKNNTKRDKGILLGVFYKDDSGNYFSFERQSTMIAEAAKVNRIPVFGLLDFNLGHGIVGGWLIGGRAQGKLMAERGLRILEGRAVPDEMSDYWPTLDQTAKLSFDQSRADESGVDISRFYDKPEVRIIHKPEDPLPWKTIGLLAGATIVALITSLVLILRVYRQSRHHRNLYTSRLVGLFQTTLDGARFMNLTPKTAEILGYGSVKEALRARPADCYANSADREQLVADLRVHGHVDRYQVTMVRQDRTRRDVTLGAYLYDNYLEGAIIDVTDFDSAIQETAGRLWGVPDGDVEAPDVFLVSAFGHGLGEVYESHIKPVCEKLDLTIKRADDFFRPGPILPVIWSALYGARLIIADLSFRNPNVFYELGIAHIIGKNPILISQDHGDNPFDVRVALTLFYDLTPEGTERFHEQLEKMIRECLPEISGSRSAE